MLGTPIASQPTAFHWDGFYAGLGIGTELWLKPASVEHKIEVKARAGANVTAGQFLFGAELFYTYYYAFEPNATGSKIGATGRAGYLVDPNILIYGEAGAYHDWVFGNEALFGGGVEFAVADNVSIDVKYDYDLWLPMPGYASHQASVSALFHF
jgi:opacity protein-like surface antigen